MACNAPSDSNQSSRPIAEPRFETLNDDVMQLILAELKGHRTALSSVSRFFRALCMPIIFKHVVWGAVTQTTRRPPLEIWPYIHILTLATVSKDRYFPLLPTQLPKMPQIHTIRLFGLQDGVPLQLFKAIYSAPGLESLDIVDCPYARVGLYDASAAPIIVPMRKFAYRTRRISHQHTLYGHLVRGPEVIYELQLEATSLWRMLVQMNLTLETLMIPGETAQFELMADLPWPSLREFTLYGLPPVTNVSIASVLSRMPLLSSLHLEFFQLPESPRFLVCPPGSDEHFPPNLESFTLTWPSPDDQVFSKLSAALTHLSLRDSPRLHSLFQFPRDNGGSWIPILTGHELLPLLQAVDIKGLKSLELLYYGGVGERDMLRFISTSSPSLHKLELHRFRSDRWSRNDGEVPIDAIGDILSACKSLRILRVNLDFHEEFQSTPYRKKNIPFDETARALAERIPTLDEIALFYADTVDYSKWSTYFVTRNDSGGVTLLHVGYMNDCPVHHIDVRVKTGMQRFVRV